MSMHFTDDELSLLYHYRPQRGRQKVLLCLKQTQLCCIANSDMLAVATRLINQIEAMTDEQFEQEIVLLSEERNL